MGENHPAGADGKRPAGKIVMWMDAKDRFVEAREFDASGVFIRAVRLKPAVAEQEKDDEKGQIFIRPVSPDSTKPINLFVSTER